MKSTRTILFIHIFLAVVFSIVYFLVFDNRNIGFYSFFLCTLLTLLNTALLFVYFSNAKAKNSEIMDYTILVPPVVAYLAQMFLTVKMHAFIEPLSNKYFAILVLIFSISLLVQFLLVKARKRNLQQEADIRKGRLDRLELEESWERIALLTSDNDDASKLARNITEDIKYSDPVSEEELIPLETEIFSKTKELLKKIELAEQDVDVVQLENEVRELILKRNKQLKEIK